MDHALPTTTQTGKPPAPSGPTVGRWTAALVARHVADTPNMDWKTETDDDYQARYVRPVEDFGLSIRHDPIRTPDSQMRGELMPRGQVPVHLIRSSTQIQGVCLDVIDHYVKSPHDLLDRDGWFDNQIPVLFIRDDGTYTVRDGNHRCIAALLRGDETIDAHIVP